MMRKVIQPFTAAKYGVEPRGPMEPFKAGELLLILESPDEGAHVKFAKQLEFVEEQVGSPGNQDLRPKRPYITTRETLLANTEEV